MLAYAAQGLPHDQGSSSGAQIRSFLLRCDQALTGISRVFNALVNGEKLKPADRYRAFGKVLQRDARDAQAAVRLVVAQSSISSQLVDNLNASIHLRALLTDLFLIDEALRGRAG
jgi:hypothetical protein